MTRQEKTEARRAQLQRERALMLDDIGRPGFQILIKKLQDLSDEMLMKYDSARDMEEVMRIQAYRDVVETIIPRALEQMMNVDEPSPRWSFRIWAVKALRWAKDTNRAWLDHAKGLFSLEA